MTKVLVVYGSRHGATEGIAQRIGEVLRAQGLAAPVVSADMVADGDVRDADAFVVGSAVYMGRWLKEPTEFLENYPTVLRPDRSGSSAAVRCPARPPATTRTTPLPIRSVRGRTRKRGPQEDRGPRRIPRRP